MGQKTEYTCDVCHAKRDPTALLGFEFESTSSEMFRIMPACQVQRHLCRECTDGLRSMLAKAEALHHWKRPKATPEEAADC